MKGKWFKEYTPEDTFFVCADAGIIPYYSERKAIDYFGLMDKYIARTKGSHYDRNSKEVIDYILSRNPDYIVLVNRKYPPEGIFAGNYAIDVALFEDMDFKKKYTIYENYAGGLPYYLESGPGYYLILFKRVG